MSWGLVSLPILQVTNDYKFNLDEDGLDQGGKGPTLQVPLRVLGNWTNEGIELMSRDYEDETCHGFTIPSYYTKFTLYIWNAKYE
jgi:hypothetical protein